MSEREVILGRVRAAIGGAAPAGLVPRDYPTIGGCAPEERIALFCDRVREYRAEVRRIRPDQVAPAVGEVCAAVGARRLVIPAGLPAEWRPDGAELVVDDGLSAHELDAVDGVVTGCTVAIAETGTIVLTAAPQEGRRAITLVPDLHVCVVEEHRVVELVPEAIATVADIVRAERRPVTFISGPSATSDIELSRVEGVHGPRNLIVLVVARDDPR
jgi:L-lactate dehydrogenase complex protein LldG